MNQVAEFVKKGEKSDQEWINEGIDIRRQADGATRRVGEWYLGVQESRKNCATAQILSAKAICEQAGYNASSPSHASNLVKCFPTETKQQGFTLEECKALLPAHKKLGAEEFHGRFMSDAVAGVGYYSKLDPEWKWEGRWTLEEIKRQVAYVKTGIFPTPKSNTLEEYYTSLEDKLDDVLGALPKATARKVQAALQSILKAESKDLNQKFQDEVLKVANEKVKPLKDELSQNQQRITEDRNKLNKEEFQLKARLKGVSAFMSRKNYKLVLGCLHSDRIPSDMKERYEKAFIIMKALEPGIE